MQTTAAATAAMAFPGGATWPVPMSFASGSSDAAGAAPAPRGMRSCRRPGVEIVSLGDLTDDRLGQCREQLSKLAAEAPKYGTRSR